MASESDEVTGEQLAAEQRVRAHEAGFEGTHSNPTLTLSDDAPPPGPGATLVELHVCMGLNSCKAQAPDKNAGFPSGTRRDPEGTARMAGTGTCATAVHVCHGDNACRGQGGCGYAGSAFEQSKPGDQACSTNGSCASPINISRVFSDGPYKGKSVWRRARVIFEARMYEAGIPFGPSPAEGYPDDLLPPGYIL
jgi:hypothetical protein